ncbi:hypothetical protein SAMN04489761_0183 [Tenacibaculum sp. MAR_2009_124]|uniref:hypothetical protein n=1 Tax=Tenacibaculum sp. MAR_2009_124 TaxID=1250059 RepID=UPI0008968D7B|nr:hypothetical protein [Tenacibaculum sp. MAR_2009_124]SEB36688.1 hypothetical protein SAMN04489761_0183 [Tenacibaculum sp. MAR_2009_124]
MSMDFKQLQENWVNDKKHIKSDTDSISLIYKKIKKKQKENFFFYYGTITILITTCIAISLFFYHIAPVKQLLSRIGAGLMILGLIVRILIEVISIGKAKKINKLDDLLKTATNTTKFHSYRKFIHEIIAPTIVTLYTIGFFMITPEFSLYLKKWQVLLMNTSYVVIGILLFFIIRKGVQKEMKKLREIASIKSDIESD